VSYYFHPAAEAEYLETIAYYESRKPGLGTMYLVEFEKIMVSVCESPYRCRIERKPDIRRRVMVRFPFTILYRVASGSVQILAVAHQKRRPVYWIGRR